MAQAVKHMSELPVIVHGGGKSIKALQEKLGIEAHYIGGLRVTDAATLTLVKMVLCGQTNVDIVAALTNAGVEAQGFNGADRGLLRGVAVKHPHGDLGRVGEIVTVRRDVIKTALAERIVAVIAPVTLVVEGPLSN